MANEPETGHLVPTKDDESRLLDATLRLSETQLLAQISDETSLDGRTMGLLAFNGALLAADIAAKGTLGEWWWTVLPFLAVATALCLRSAFQENTDLGPPALLFYSNFGGHPASLARKQLLADLDDAFEKNALRVAAKAVDLRRALGILTIGLVVAAFLIALDRPSKVQAHAKCPTAHYTPALSCSNPAQAGTDAGPLGSSARRSRRSDRPLAAVVRIKRR